MGEIIDIRRRRGQKGEETAGLREGGDIFRIRLQGKEIDLVGRTLGRAFILEGFYILFDPPEARGTEDFCLRAGREVITETAADLEPCLLVVAEEGRLSDAPLKSCGEKTVLLVHGEGEPQAVCGRLGFPGTIVPLPVSAFETEDPMGIGAACAGGAARLLGVIRWTALEQALREELGLLDTASLNQRLAMALEAFDRTAPWAGSVAVVHEQTGIKGPAD